MPPARKPRWPFQPLMEASRAPSMKMLGIRLDVDPRQLRRWRDDGITDLWADRLALRLGLMPEQVWDGWFAVDTSELDAEEKAARDAAEAKRERKRERDREYRRRWRQEHPDLVRQESLARAGTAATRLWWRRYYAENGEEVRERRRARYLRQKEAS